MTIRILTQAVVAVGAAGLGAGALDAATYTLKESVSGVGFDWASSESYAEGGAPSADDTVVIPAGMTAQLAAKDIAFVNTLGRITPMDGAVLEVAVPENAEADLSVPVTCYGVWAAQKQTGRILKKGAGKLNLKSLGRVMHGGVQYADYYCWHHVAEGTLAFPATLPDSEKTLYCRGAVVDAGAWLHTVQVGHMALWGGLGGSGSVTNVGTSAATPVIDIYSHKAKGDARSVFAGRLCGRFALYGWSGFDLVGESASKSITVVVNKGGDMGVRSIGKKGGPSSFGDSDPNFNSRSAIRYLGGGEETDRTFYFGEDTTLDAGAGGLVFRKGHWGTANGMQIMRTLTLCGTNVTNESVLYGSCFSSQTRRDYGFSLIKRGPGVWRLKDNDYRLNPGIVATEEGTLRFDSIAETNEVCSLGLATALYKAVSGVPDEANRVPYAYLLGGTNEDATVTEGIMEYTGTSAGYCATRPFAIRSRGGVRTPAAPIRLNGFAAEDAGEKTLVLDGDSAGENVAAGVMDGPGVVSVLKRGPGTWHLDGARDFSGTVSVDEGTLVARASGQYGWYRFTIRETGYAADATTGSPSDFETRSVDLRELALYDADGNPLEGTLTQSNENYRAIQPGEYGYWRDGWAEMLKSRPSANALGALFSNSTARGLYMQYPKIPREDDPSTWVPIVVRMPANACPVVRFDLYYAHAASTLPHCNRQPTSFKLEGSVDGLVWDELFATNGVAYGTGAQWLSNAEVPFYSPRAGKGFAVAPENGKAVFALGNATGVSVKGGATLRVEGPSLPLVSLTVDCAAGVGTISGVTLAEQGTLVLLNVPRDGFVPIDFTGVSGWANLRNWSVSLPGLTKRRLVDVRPDGIRITSPGGLFIIR